MEALTQEQIKSVKPLGFLINRGTRCFNARVITKNGVISAEQLKIVSEAAEKFGNGTVAFTVRMTLEIVGVDFDNIEPLREYIAKAGLQTGGTGAKVRPVVACKGSTCIFGLCDTQGIAKELHERFYEGYRDVILPHKFKITVGGCPNNCAKPDLNDIGLAGCRINGENRIKIYIGGRWGKKIRIGTPLSKTFTKDEALDVVERTINVFAQYGDKGERFGETVDRLGIERIEELILSPKS